MTPYQQKLEIAYLEQEIKRMQSKLDAAGTSFAEKIAIRAELPSLRAALDLLKVTPPDLTDFAPPSPKKPDADKPIRDQEGVEPVSGASQVTTPSKTTEDSPKPKPTPPEPSPKSPQPSSTTDPIGDILERLKAERAAKKDLGDIGEGQFADINRQTEMMMMEAPPQEDIGDTLVQQQEYAGEFAPSVEDVEKAKREPLGETAGRLAIQGFMQRNFGFRPEVTFDVEEQEPGGSGSMF
tara:strand:- start:49 stop:762 length:714 start_codon:yes stop_codon:yes gene_type:complete